MPKITQQQIVDTARECLGTPFMHQGRIAGVALDCVGVAIHVAKKLGVQYKDVNGYSMLPANGLLESSLSSQSCIREVGLNEVKSGDILVMRFSNDPQHVAIFAGETIIHSYSNVGKVCEHGLNDVWKKRIVKAFRFVDVEEVA